MPGSLVFENLEAEAPIDEIAGWFHLNREQIVTVLEFIAHSLETTGSSAGSCRSRRAWMERLANGALLDAAEL